MGSNGRLAPNGHEPDEFYVNGVSQSNCTNKDSKVPSSGINQTGKVSRDVAPIAIIGMACHSSGNVSSAEGLWELCSRARSGWSPIPKERWSQEGYFHPNAARTGTYNPEGAYFIQKDVGLFDAPFFNISALEAKSIDPQQRLLLECTYEALENAGIPKESIAGQSVGVFVAGSFSEYSLFCLRDPDRVPAYEATGTAQSVLANRLSYYFDLKGPSVTVDTACSSGLSALHLACQSLRSGECSQAIVGASHLNIMPDMFISMSNSRLLSKSGKSFSFDDRAEGFGRGEGIGCIVLKPLSAAIADGDRIRAVVRNTGMNQDGRTQGISMPNGAAQAELIRSVYESAGLDVTDTGYVEAHGTGTKVGDPIEAAALHSVFGNGRSSKDPLYIGSVKSNIGHTEGASGIISVIKTALMLEKGFILPNINFNKPNEAIPLTEWAMKVPKSQIPWPRKKRLASVNNFGFGGTNCHVVLEGLPRPSRTKPVNGQKPNEPANEFVNGLEPVRSPKNVIASYRTRYLYILSANSEKSAKSQIQALGIYLEQRPEALELSLMGKIAYTLSQRRSLLPWRVAVSATTSSELIHKLANPDLRPVSSFYAPKIAFVFNGQGAQWHAMGRELIKSYPVFSSTIEAADKCLSSLGASWSLEEELLKDAKSSIVDQTHISQPACTAIQIALVNLLISWGVHPAAVVGHSSGEIAAAFAAGILSQESCMAIAYYRGIATVNFKSRFPDLRGTMLAVGAGTETVQPLVDGLKRGRVVIACVNSPSSITASGDEEAIDELQQRVQELQLFNRKLRVDMAYHSHHMELVANDYLASLEGIRPRKSSRTKIFSSVTGCEIDGSNLEPAYWVNNLTNPVQFARALRSMGLSLHDPIASRQENCILLELGPHAALEGPIKQILRADGGELNAIEYVPTLVRNRDAIETMQQLGGVLCTKGLRLDFEAINFPQSRDKPTTSLLTDLPSYPWQHNTRYWHESRIADNHRFGRLWPRNDVLGALADDSNDLEPRWRNVIRLEDMPWLRDHQIQSKIVFPMAGYVTMAMEAAFQRAKNRNITFDKFEFREISANRALILEESAEVETMITLRPYNEGTRRSTDSWDEFRIFAWTTDRGWVEHCRGMVGVQKNKGPNSVDGQRQMETERAFVKSQSAMINNKCIEIIDVNKLAANLQRVGVYYGPAFQGFLECRTAEQLAIAEVEIADTVAMMPKQFESELIMHPATLDLIIQILWPVLGAGRTGWDKIYMPSGFKRLSISSNVTKLPGARLRVYGTSPKILPMVAKPVDLDVFAVEETDPGHACVILEGYTVTPVHHDVTSLDRLERGLCFKTTWQPLPKTQIKSSTEVLEIDTVIVYEDLPAEFPLSKLQTSIEALTGKEPVTSSLKELKPEPKLYVVISELQAPWLASVDSEGFAAMQKLFTTAKGILWVVQGAYQDSCSPDGNMVTGLARTIRSETDLKFATIDLDPQRPDFAPDASEVITEALQSTFSSLSSIDDCEMEYMERSGLLHVPRIISDDEMNSFINRQLQESKPELQPFFQKGRSLKLKISSPGLLDTLHFIDDYTLSATLAESSVEIEVKAVGLNFKDVMIAMGQLVNEHIGVECSGVITRIGSAVSDFKVGDRVCAISEGTFASYIRCSATCVVRIEDSLSFETAATIPLIWTTAYYSLIHVGRLEKGESVLIHAAAGGVGQAAIILAQMMGADIFVTVGSLEKKNYIMNNYKIPADRIFFSRDTSFASQIKTATNGQGVDVILNSLAGDALLATWQCLSSFGRFVEIGKRDIVSNTRLEMAQFSKNVTFSSVDLIVVLMERPSLMKRLLSEVFDLYRKGIVRPITPLSIFSISEIESAFRSLQSGKNLGKISVTLGETDLVKTVPAKFSSSLLRADSSYLIIGGTGGLGRSIARWMAQKGAKCIILASRSSEVSDQVNSLIRDLGAEGTTVSLRQCDVSKHEDVARLASDCSRDLPPIRGVIHSAMVLNKDVLFEKMSFDNYKNVTESKVTGAWNLHNCLSKTDLEFFIMLSSVSGIIGNKGQAAYAAANTFMNAFAQFRLGQGCPATAIDLAAVSDVGYLAENTERREVVMGSMQSDGVSELELHALIAAAISKRMMDSCSNHCITGLDIAPGSQAPYWMREAKFSSIRPSLETPAKLTGKILLRQSLKQASSLEEAEGLVYSGLVEKVSTILMIDKDDIDGRQPIAAYGLDSLVAVEIRNWITRETDASLQILELLSSSSLIALSQLVVKKSAFIDPKLFDENA